MQTLSSARRTCMADASAVEWTATVWIPISRQARSTRSAISPRLAISTFSIMAGRCLFQNQDDLVELDRVAVRDQDARDLASLGRADLVHHLHGLDDEERLAGRDRVADAHERRRARLSRKIGGADHRGL